VAFPTFPTVGSTIKALSDRPVLVDAHQIGDAASIVAIVLVAKTGLQRRGRVPRIDADHRPAIPLQPRKQPSGGTTRLQADPLDGKPSGVDKACDTATLLRPRRFRTRPALVHGREARQN
jgi:hypothetical protein